MLGGGGRAVVTGASSGIGRELARDLAARGHALLLVARRADRLEEVAAELRDRHGVAVKVWPCDLADRDQRAALVKELRSRAVCVLCANAGFASFGLLADADADREAAVLTVNVTALHELTLAVLPDMVARDDGAILMTGSTAGMQPLPTVATYAATKAFVNTFAQALSLELHRTNVTCTLLVPGPVRTEFFQVAGVGRMQSVTPWLSWQDPQRVATDALNAMERGRSVVTPGPWHKVQALAGQYMPRRLLLLILRLASPAVVRLSESKTHEP